MSARLGLMDWRLERIAGAVGVRGTMGGEGEDDEEDRRRLKVF